MKTLFVIPIFLLLVFSCKSSNKASTTTTTTTITTTTTTTTSDDENASSSLIVNYKNTSELEVNGYLLDYNSKVSDLENVLGKASRSVDYPSEEVGYFYDDTGIVLMAKDNLVKGVGINFNWDGDKKFPEQSFTGKLMIGDLEVNNDVKQKNLASNKAVEFSCPIPIMCVCLDRAAKVRGMISFDEGKIGQAIFTLDK